MRIFLCNSATYFRLIIQNLIIYTAQQRKTLWILKKCVSQFSPHHCNIFYFFVTFLLNNVWWISCINLHWLKSITLQQTRSYVSAIGIPGGKKLLTSLFIPSCMKLAPWPQLEMPDTLNVSFFIWYNHNSSGICTSWQNSLVKMTMFYFVTTIVSVSSVVSESLKSLNSTCPCSLSSFVHTLNCP